MKIRQFLSTHKLKVAWISFLLVLFAFIAGDFLFHYFSTQIFNNTEHVFTKESSSELVKFSTYPRGGQSDSWVKENVLTKSGETTLTATIFESRIANTHPYVLKKWGLRFNIEKDCYLNNGWCGTVEIHQNVKKEEKIQILDLREFKKEHLILDYSILDQEVLIHLYAGDYIIYNPHPINEMRIEGNGTKLFIGLIFYYEDKDFNLDDYIFNYYLERKVFVGNRLYAFAALVCVWILLFIGYVVHEISTARAYKELLKKDRIIDEFLCVFSNFVDAKDSYTNGHSSRVAEYSMRIAEKLGLSEKECKEIYQIALLHDCGKCYIADNVLKKKGRLTDDEYDQIKKHTEYGAKILSDFVSFPEIYNGALYHHERYDGTGYPTGKKGEEIPLIGRIICVADAFDAMDSDRCYRAPLPREKIISEIERCKGTQFDPKIADVFLEILREELTE